MELAEVQKHWNHLGSTDPLWAILTEPAKRFGGWDGAEFFASGVEAIDTVMAEVAALGLDVRHRRALDFGCGVGRLTQALCRHFERCDGVDIAPSMIDQARRYNQHGDRCHYHLNARDDLSLFPDGAFDLVNSYIVLQHIEPRYMEAYLREFVRVLAPGGVIHVQIPTEHVRLAIDPLPEEACRAGLDVLDAPTALPPGASCVVQVRIENRSPIAWPAHGSAAVERPIHLGNHWLDASGTPVVVDDGRVVFPTTLHPGESVVLRLALRAPAVPASYLLEIDLVQEGVAWFGPRGSATPRIPVVVGEPAASLASRLRRWLRPSQLRRDEAHDNFEAIMEMYVLPEARVRAVVEEAGASVRSVRHWPGGDYRHATYFITRPNFGISI